MSTVHRLCSGLTVFLALAAFAHASDAIQTTPEQKALLAELGKSPHKILFEAYNENNWDLFVMNADGTGKRNLTQTPDVHEMYPQASRDGSKICFLVDVPKDGDTIRSVWYMNADGTGRKLVAEKARQPCWSPDGTKIAFLKQEFSRFQIKDFASKGVFIYDLKTGKTTEHPNKDLFHLYTLNWSPDGKWFVSTIHAGMGFGHAILAFEADGKGVYDLKIGGCRPCLSPDGRRVTWSLDDHTIDVADLDFSGPQPKVENVRTLDKRKEPHLYHPDFSPDGKYITYSLGPGGRMPENGPGTHVEVAEMVGVRGKWNLYLRKADCTGPIVQLTSDESMSNKESEWLPGGMTKGGAR